MRRRKRYARWPTFDLYSGLGPGDPGYRLRPGASGFDPVEMYAEYGRVLGNLFSSALRGEGGGVHRIARLIVFLTLLMLYTSHFIVALLLAGAYAIFHLAGRFLRRSPGSS